MFLGSTRKVPGSDNVIPIHGFSICSVLGTTAELVSCSLLARYLLCLLMLKAKLAVSFLQCKVCLLKEKKYLTCCDFPELARKESDIPRSFYCRYKYWIEGLHTLSIKASPGNEFATEG